MYEHNVKQMTSSLVQNQNNMYKHCIRTQCCQHMFCIVFAHMHLAYNVRISFDRLMLQNECLVWRFTHVIELTQEPLYVYERAYNI